jgi:hypothetical protein
MAGNNLSMGYGSLPMAGNNLSMDYRSRPTVRKSFATAERSFPTAELFQPTGMFFQPMEMQDVSTERFLSAMEIGISSTAEGYGEGLPCSGNAAAGNSGRFPSGSVTLSR